MRQQYGGYIEQVNTVTSAAGTTVLVNTSKQIQELIGTLAQNFQLPDATTFSTVGAHFEFYNGSTGSLVVKDAGSNTLATVPAGSSLLVKLTANGTANGTWRQFSGSGGGGASFATSSPAGNVTTITNGTMYLMDSSAARTIQLPAPAVGAYFYVKDKIGTMSSFPTTLLRNGSELIERLGANYALEADFGEWLVFSDGTDWYVA